MAKRESISKKVGRLNDQKPKPLLGNGKLHGVTETDNAGGANPPPRNPGKASKKGN